MSDPLREAARFVIEARDSDACAAMDKAVDELAAALESSESSTAPQVHGGDGYGLEAAVVGAVEMNKKLRELIEKQDGRGTCANMRCDAFHMHDDECLWGEIVDLARAPTSFADSDGPPPLEVHYLDDRTGTCAPVPKETPDV